MNIYVRILMLKFKEFLVRGFDVYQSMSLTRHFVFFFLTKTVERTTQFHPLSKLHLACCFVPPVTKSG